MTKFQVIARRFLKGFASGAIGAMVPIISSVSVNDWSELSSWFAAIAFAGLVGGISGLVLAIDKYLRWVDEEDNQV